MRRLCEIVEAERLKKGDTIAYKDESYSQEYLEDKIVKIRKTKNQFNEIDEVFIAWEKSMNSRHESYEEFIRVVKDLT